MFSSKLLSAFFTLGMLASQCVASVSGESIAQDSTVTLRYASRHAKVSDVEKRVLPKGYTMVPMGMFRSGDAHSKLGTEGLNGCIGVAVLGTSGPRGKVLAHVSPAGSPDHTVHPPVIPVGDFKAQIAAVKAYIVAHRTKDLQHPVVVISIPASGNPGATVKADMITEIHKMCTDTGATLINPPHQRIAHGTGAVGRMLIESDNHVIADDIQIY